MNNIYKLVAVKARKHNLSAKAIVIDYRPDLLNHDFLVFALGVLTVTTQDFNPLDNSVVTCYDTSSYQVRPKRLFLNKKGLHFENKDKKMQYLTLDGYRFLKASSELGEYLPPFNQSPK
jgi:hypothetical protein